MDEGEKPAEGVLRAKFKVVTEEPPKVAHVVNFHRLGTDVVMTMGRLDIMKVATEIERFKAEKKDPTAEMELEVEVFDRFALSPDAFQRLVESANTIRSAMVQTGHIQEAEGEGDSNAENTDKG